MTYINYINKNFVEVHRETNWKRLYEGKDFSVIDNQNFQTIITSLKCPLTRADVFHLYEKEDLYTAFVATMLWGGHGLGPGNSWKHFIDTMTTPKKRIVRILADISTLSIDDAFLSFNKKQVKDMEFPHCNKIAGIGPSYFTKILYFMRYKSSSPHCLIYDKWGMWIHAALCLDIPKYGLSYVKEHFKFGKKGNGYYVKNGQTLRQYKDYISLLSTFSNTLDKKPESGILEEYLFGDSMKGYKNKDNLNPRLYLKQYLINSLGLDKNTSITPHKRANAPKTEAPAIPADVKFTLKLHREEKTFSILGKNHPTKEGVEHVYIQWQEEDYEVQIGAYPWTARGRNTIDRLIRKMNIHARDTLTCRLEIDGTTHRYIIQE